MVVLIVAAAVYGVAQLAVLGWVARSVRWATVVAAVPVGLLAAAPVAVGLQWAWTRAWSAATGTPVHAVVGVAGYTVDPVIEELVKLAPLVLVWWLVPRVRRQWGYTDVLLVAAGVGSGFGLAEQLLRYSTRAHLAFGDPWQGWTFPFGWAAVHVPGPTALLGSWLPAGAQVQSFFDPSPIDAINIHLVLSAVAGLGLSLLLAPPRRGGGRRNSTPQAAATGHGPAPAGTAAQVPVRRPSRLLRWVGAGLIVFAALDHAAINTTGGGHLAQTLAGPLDWARHAVWAYPLVALAGAVLLDRRTLALGRRLDPGALLAGEHTGPAEAAAQWARLAAGWPPRSLAVTTGFTRLRRTHWTTLARTPAPGSPAPGAPAPSTAAPGAGTDPVDDATGDAIGDALRSLAPILDTATGTGAAQVWARARAHLADARTQSRAPGSGGSSSSGRILRIALITAWLAIIAAPLTYLVAGSIPALAGLQKTLTGPTAFRAMIAASALGAAWTAWTLARTLRRLRAARRGHPLGEIPARLALAAATRTGSLTVTALAWWLLAHGSTATSPLITNYHILDAIGQALLILAIALALTAIILDPPLALVALAGGGSMLVPAAITAATIETLAVAGALGATGIALMNTDGDVGTGGTSGGGAEPPRLDGTGKVHGDIPDHVPRSWTTEQLEELETDLQRSIRTRKLEQRRLGEDPAHRRRLGDEERLLRQIQKILSGT